MKKYFVIGNPIDHSLSPTIHNYWFKKNKINAVYDKILLKKNSEIKNLINKIRSNEIHGLNVTVPLKTVVVPYLDRLSLEAEVTKSVNTISLEGKEVVGHNTDVAGFELAIRYKKFDVNEKKVLIIGAGGVVTSIIYALNKMSPKKIFLMNRTMSNAEKIKKIFQNIDILEWGKNADIDMIINATSVGLSKNDKIDLKIEDLGKKKFFYDVIYKPSETLFLKEAKDNGNYIENGKMMFIYQAHQAFFIWNKILPEINEEVLELVR